MYPQKSEKGLGATHIWNKAKIKRQNSTSWITTNVQIDPLQNNIHWSKVHCGSAFEPGASLLLHTTCVRSWCVLPASCVAANNQKKKGSTRGFLRADAKSPAKKQLPRKNSKVGLSNSSRAERNLGVQLWIFAGQFFLRGSSQGILRGWAPQAWALACKKSRERIWVAGLPMSVAAGVVVDSEK